MSDQWLKQNRGILSTLEESKLTQAHVLLVGCGGIGGNLSNLLIRLGVRYLTLVDFDQFEETNLNRQLFSSVNTLGLYKAKVIKDELLKINPEAMITVIVDKVENIRADSFSQVDFLIDALDNAASKIYLANISKQHHIPLLHGSCGGWYGQFGWIEPEASVIEEIYRNLEPGLEQKLKNPSFAPAIVASFMASEFVKRIQNDPETMHSKLTLIDFKSNSILSVDRRD